MPIGLVVIDHHPSRGKGWFGGNPKVEIPEFPDQDGVAGIVAGHLDDGDFQYVRTDTDVDGIASAVQEDLLDSLLHPKRERPRLSATRRPFDSAQLAELARQGVERVLCLDWYPVWTSDFFSPESDRHVERLTILNPSLSGLPDRYCASNIVHDAARLLVGDAADGLMLDIGAVGTASDYGITGVKNGRELMRRLGTKYPEEFPGLADLAAAGKLTNETALQGNLERLSDMFWAPYVLAGEGASEETIRLIADNPDFSIRDLLRERNSGNPAVGRLRELGGEFEGVLAEEWKAFGEKARFDEDAKMIFYTTDSPYPGLAQIFSNKVVKARQDYVVAVAESPRADGQVKYSLRRTQGRRESVNLGAIAQGMNVGGGAPSTAGCVVRDAAKFEEELAKAVYAAESGGA